MFGWLAPQEPQQQRVMFHVEGPTSGIDTSSQIMVMCYTASDKKLALPCAFEWARCSNGQRQPLPMVKGNTYVCEPSDVGAIIEVQIRSLDEDNPGMVLKRFGPVQIDAMIKRSVVKILTEGHSSFPVKFTYNQAGLQDLECTLRMTEDCIRLHYDNKEVAYRFEYQAGDPVFECYSTDLLGVTVALGKRNEACFDQFLQSLDVTCSSSHRIFQKKYRLGFVSRISRDMFLLAHKAFCAKKILEASMLLQRLSQQFNSPQLFNYQIEIASLNEELTKMAHLNCTLEEDVRMYKQEVVRLEDDIQALKNHLDRALKQNVALENNLNNISNIECAGDERADSLLEYYAAAVPKENPISMLKSPVKSHLEHGSDDDLDYSRSRARESVTIKKQLKEQLGERTPSRQQLKIDALVNEIAALNERLSKEEQTIRDLNKLLTYYTGLTKTLEQTENENSSLKVQNGLMQSQLTELEGQLRTMQRVNDLIATIKPTEKESSRSEEEDIRHLKSQLSKYRKRYQEVLEEVKLLRRGNDQLNRSRNITGQSFAEQECRILKQQCDLLATENNRLKEACDRYRPVTQEVCRLKSQKELLEQSLHPPPADC